MSVGKCPKLLPIYNFMVVAGGRLGNAWTSEHIQTENSGYGWDRRCIPLQTLNRGAIIEDPDLGRKLTAELGEIADWALSMDKAERDQILLVP